MVYILKAAIIIFSDTVCHSVKAVSVCANISSPSLTLISICFWGLCCAESDAVWIELVRGRNTLQLSVSSNLELKKILSSFYMYTYMYSRLCWKKPEANFLEMFFFFPSVFFFSQRKGVFILKWRKRRKKADRW